MVIKICGIRRFEDIEIINKYKPDYIGFVFAESRRQVTPEFAAELSAGLDKSVKTVGVFVNAPKAEVENTAKIAGLSAVQLHGDETAEYIRGLSVDCEIWKAVRLRDGDDIPDFDGADKILLDKFKDTGYGGSGEAFDWSKVGKIKTQKPIILAGGLNENNVKKGIEIFSPYGVDVSSGVETDGFKDEIKIKRFTEAVRAERR